MNGKEKLESYLGRETHIRGDITSKGTLKIDGSIEGNVEADQVVLGEKATLQGNISAVGIVVGGSIEGNVSARESIEIKHKGRVKGDIKTPKFSVIEGGIIDGRVSMSREDSKVVEIAKDILKESR